MTDLSRQLWTARAVTALPALAPAVLLAREGPLGWAVLAGALGIELGCIAATARQVRALTDGEHGELMYVGGQRVPLSVVRTTRRWEALEAVMGFTLAVLAVAVTWGTAWFWVAVGLGAVTLLVLGAVTWQRWISWRTLDAIVALMEQTPEKALKALGPLKRRPALAAAVRGLEAQALAQLERPAEARRLLEDGWSGQLDDSASSLVVARIGAGDLALAERWLQVQEGTNRYHRYLRALVAGHLALARSDVEGVRAAVTRVLGELPPWYRRDLELLMAAAEQLSGDGPSARARLEALGEIERERWRRHGHPRLWRLVDDAWHGRPTADLPGPARLPAQGPAVAPEEGPGDVFAPPTEDPPPASPTGRLTELGAVPVEWVTIGTRRRKGTRIVLLVLGGILVVLSTMLAVLGTLAALLGSLHPEELAFGVFVVALALSVAAALGAVELVSRRLRRSGPAVLLSDGTTLSDAPALLWWLWGGLPLLLGLGVLAAAPVAIEVTLGGTGWTLLLAGPVGLLMLLGGRQRTRLLGAVRAVHFAPPEQAVAASAGLRGYARGWHAVALMVAGRPDEARAVLEPLMVLGGHTRELRSWLGAGRGEVDLERLLGMRPPRGEGASYRHEVAIRLAALHAGRADRVVGRIELGAEIADGLPNRFGGLLHRLNLEILRRAAPERAAPYAEANAAAIAVGGWAERCWPGLVTPADER